MADNEAVLDRQLRRQALQLAAMLPDDPDAAARVLGYAYELIEDFIRPAGNKAKPKSAVGTGGPLRLVVSHSLISPTDCDAS